MNELFDEVRENLRTLRQEVDDLSDAVVDKGGSEETHLPAISDEISNFWTGGDGIVYTEIDKDYHPIKIEFRNVTNTNIYSLDMSKLEEIRFKPTPAMTESTVTIPDRFFRNATSLRYVDFDRCNLIIGASAFSGCTGLESINFGSAKELKNLAFHGTGLTSVNLGNLETVQDNAFDQCNDLVSVDFGSMTSISGDYIFKNCTSLTTIDFHNLQTISGYGMFYGCTALTTVDVGDLSSLGSGTFYECSSLESVNLGNLTILPESVFYYCASLKTIDISNIKTIGRYAFAYSGLTTIDLSDVESIDSSAFEYCLTGAIDIPKVTRLNGYTFNGSRITSVNIPNVTQLGSNEFYYCAELTSVTLSPSLTTIPGYTFYNCTSLKNINLSNVKQIYSYAFQQSGLESLTLNEANIVEAKAFVMCTQLETIELIRNESTDLSPINLRCFINSYAFAGCISLLSFKVKQMQYNPSGSYGDLSLIVESGAFSGCSSLKTVKFIVTTERYAYVSDKTFDSSNTSLTDIYVSWGENDPPNQTAPWGAPAGVTIHYNYTE